MAAKRSFAQPSRPSPADQTESSSYEARGAEGGLPGVKPSLFASVPRGFTRGARGRPWGRPSSVVSPHPRLHRLWRDLSFRGVSDPVFAPPWRFLGIANHPREPRSWPEYFVPTSPAQSITSLPVVTNVDRSLST